MTKNELRRLANAVTLSNLHHEDVVTLSTFLRSLAVEPPAKCTCQPLAQQLGVPFGLTAVAVDPECPVHREPNDDARDAERYRKLRHAADMGKDYEYFSIDFYDLTEKGDPRYTGSWNSVEGAALDEFVDKRLVVNREGPRE